MEDIRGNQYPARYAPPFGAPEASGLYDPQNEHENCGVGFVAHIKGVRSRQIIDDADRILRHVEVDRDDRLADLLDAAEVGHLRRVLHQHHGAVV